MDRIKRLKMKEVDSTSLFLLLEECMKTTILQDLNHIYQKEARLLDSETPWIFQLEK